MEEIKKICIVFTHHKLGDLIWQIPYIKAISENYNQKIHLIVRKKTQAKDIFKDCDFIEKIEYNDFRKNIFYFIEIYKLWKYFKKQNFSHIFFLDKVNRGAIAAKLANIKIRIGLGFNNQKKWITSEPLDDGAIKLNQSEQSLALLKKNNIPIKNLVPKINIDDKRLLDIEPNLAIYDGRKISLGIDSFEKYKMWYEEDFIELAEKLYKKGICQHFYLICSPQNHEISKKIINLSKREYFIDCAKLNLIGITKVIRDSHLFIGNNSGPLNLASALGVKTYGLIANAPVSELKNSEIIPILPDEYKDNVFNKNREEMKKLSADKVFNYILKSESI